MKANKQTKLQGWEEGSNDIFLRKKRGKLTVWVIGATSGIDASAGQKAQQVAAGSDGTCGTPSVDSAESDLVRRILKEEGGVDAGRFSAVALTSTATNDGR